jgi:hypothetical protein
LQNTIHIRVYLIVEKPQECYSKRRDVCFPIPVVFNRTMNEMRVSIQFDSKLDFGTVEIYNVTINTILPPEFESIQLATFEVFPQKFFGLGGMVTQLASSCLFGGFIEVFGQKEPPLVPLLRKEGRRFYPPIG